MKTLVQDIKKGDVFRRNSGVGCEIIASDDAIVVGNKVFIPFGGEEGLTYVDYFGKTVEKIDGPE